MCVCVYIHTYIYTQTHTHTYICMYIANSRHPAQHLSRSIQNQEVLSKSVYTHKQTHTHTHTYICMYTALSTHPGHCSIQNPAVLFESVSVW